MKYKKLLSLLIAGSFLGISIQPALADEYMVLPPVVDQTGKSPDKVLPGLESIPNIDGSTPVQQPLKGTISTVPVGTAFQIITNARINSKNSQVGELFSATLNQPISVEGNTIVPAGSEVFGQITYIEDAGRIGRNAKMEIKFTSIKPPYSNRIPIMGKVLTKDNSGIVRGGSVKNQLVKNISTSAVATGSGALAGAGIGALTGSAGTGTAIGAASGSVLGLGFIFWRKGKPVKVPVGTKMIVVLEQPFSVGQ